MHDASPDAAGPRELIYLTDPMCSWCYGFAPVVGRLREAYADRVPLRVVLGGLFPGTTEPLDEAGKATVREHWQHVADATGRSFDYGFFERDGFVYDTEPACRAAVTARRLSPGFVFDMVRRLHSAFYRENADLTDPEVLSAIAAELGFDRARFAAEFAGEAAREETLADFAFARRIGVASFPTLLAREGDRAVLLTMGYRTYEEIERALEVWLGDATVH